MGVSIGPFSIVNGNVSIGDGSSDIDMGYPTPQGQGRRLTIGCGARIRSHSVFYEGSTFGDKLAMGHPVTVREGTESGTHLQIGTLGDIQGTCRIGDLVWLFPHVVLTNDPHPPSEVRLGGTLGDYAAVAAMSVNLPGITIGCGALVASHSSVRRDVEPDTVVAGVPATAICATSDIVRKDGTGRPAYPWRRHFHRGYPDEAVVRWLSEFGNGAPLLDP